MALFSLSLARRYDKPINFAWGTVMLGEAIVASMAIPFVVAALPAILLTRKLVSIFCVRSR